MNHPIKSTSFLRFAWPDIGEEEIREVVDTLRSGWITTGMKTKQFEADFAQYIGSNVQAVAVNSATAGLHLVLEAIGIKTGDEVIVPSYTFTSTAEVVHYLGARPVIVDVDPDTYNIDPQAIIKAITPKTRAIIPVHFAGLACQMDAILSIAHQYHLRVVEDAAHALPTTYCNQRIGALQSDATVFSFYATKTMTTGEGGMIVTRDPTLLKRCQVMRLHGINQDAFDRYHSKTPAWYYEVVAPGFKYNMTDIAAAIGIHQLGKLDRFHQRRVQLAKRYDKALSLLPIRLPPRSISENQHAWHLYPVQLTGNAPIDRAQLITNMAKLGIGCSVHFIPLHRQPVWKNTYNLDKTQFPHADALFRHEVSLPLYTTMTDEDQDNVIHALEQCLLAHESTQNNDQKII